MVTTRLIHDADILQPATGALREKLESRVGAQLGDVPDFLPELPGQVRPLTVDPDTVLGQLWAAAWSGSTAFSATRTTHQQSISEPAALSSRAELLAMLRDGGMLIAGRSEEWCGPMARVHDHVVASYRATCEISILVSASPQTLQVPTSSLVGVIRGACRIDAAGSEISLGPTEVTRLGQGDWHMEPDGLTVLLHGRLGFFDSRAVLAQLRRRAGFEPLFRADIPRDLDREWSSYKYSLLDDESAFQQRALEMLDDSMWESAQCWWEAHLCFSGLSRGQLGDGSGQMVLRLPAPPSFLDDRFERPEGAVAVLASSGHMVALSSSELDEFSALAGGAGVRAAGTDLCKTIEAIGLLGPAPSGY